MRGLIHIKKFEPSFRHTVGRIGKAGLCVMAGNQQPRQAKEGQRPRDRPQIVRVADTVQSVQELRIDIPRYSLYTPYPGTPLFHRLLKEERILSFNWEDYDTMHVVIRPLKMEPEELYQGFKWAYRETFRFKNVWKRAAGVRLNSAINLVGNLTYRGFVHRLYHEPRYARPYSADDPGTPPAAEFWADAFPGTQRHFGVIAQAGRIDEMNPVCSG